MRRMLEYQIWHLLAAGLVLFVGWLYVRSGGALQGAFLGLSASFWFWSGLWLAIAHQALVMFVWRSQLHYQWITRRFEERGFGYYGRAFGLVSFARFLSVFSLSIATRGTLGANPWLLNGLGLLFLALVIFIMEYFKILDS